jgi:hypothetical protein
LGVRHASSLSRTAVLSLQVQTVGHAGCPTFPAALLRGTPSLRRIFCATVGLSGELTGAADRERP